MKNLLIRHSKAFLIAGYIVAVILLSMSAAFAFYSLTSPVEQPQIISAQLELATPSVPSKMIAPMITEDITALRDPFAKYVLQVAPIVSKTDIPDLSGLKVKAIIMSLKSGVILEDTQHGAVYFLSEGDNVNGILVKGITKSGVTVEAGGKQVMLSFSGDQK